jgi:hypothetical protein
MGMRQSALHTEILQKLVREPGIHAHGVSGGGQVIDDAVPALLKTADEVILRWARAEYLAYRCVERQCHQELLASLPGRVGAGVPGSGRQLQGRLSELARRVTRPCAVYSTRSSDP